MEYKKVKTKRDIDNDPRVDSIHKEGGTGGDSQYWCYIQSGWQSSKGTRSINESTIKGVCSEINSLTKSN